MDADGAFPRESVDALGKAGFLGLTIATEYGGIGQGPRVACAVLDELAQGCASSAMIYLMHLCGIAAYGAVPQKTERQLRLAAGGTHLSTLAWSEFGSRSHFWVPTSQETQQNGRVTITAAKSFVTSAGYADGYVVTTRWSQAEKPLDSTSTWFSRTTRASGWPGPGMPSGCVGT